ncbi:MAG: NAD-dependent epimerase/dehydratase family protein [Candidatus Hydrogenedentota bacterium]|nr:MAG: NAD-dependent epimerase/dehydratase family protein [Candidatus Hydrogenedentota bacterium]
MKSRGRILVTGGAGFIGSHLARLALQKDYRVTILDNLSTGSERNIPEGSDFVAGDVSRERTWKRLRKERYDAVFHLAAQSSGEVSHSRPGWDLKANTLGTLHALHFARDFGARFLYSSSMAVYGEPDRVPVRETDPCRPLSFYGISKLCAEHYISYFSRKGLPTTVFRLFSVYGPGQNLANLKQGIVSIYLAFLLEGRPVHVKGSPDRFRDLIYIDDVLKAWWKAFRSKAAIGEVLNLGTGRKTTVRELVEAEIKALGRKPGEVEVRYQGSTPDDQFGLYADIRRTVRVLSPWRPRVTLKAGLKKMIAWAQNEAR